MYRFVVLLAFGLAASIDIPEQLKECVEKEKYPPQCCKTFKNKLPMVDENVKECMLIPDEPGSCERETCFVTKKGFLSSDGTIDMDAVQKHFEEKMADNKDLLEAIKSNCIEGDFEKYGEPDDCTIRKFGNCLRWQFKWRCPDFSDDGPCSGIKDVAKKCIELIS